MAYTDHRTDTNRAAKIIAVSAFHGAIIYALVTGLAVVIDEPEIWVMPTDSYKIDPPPPPPPDPKPITTPEVIKFVPPTPVQLLPILPLGDLPVNLPPLPLPVDTPQLLPVPSPDPAPKFTPARAKPRNNPGLWVSTSDYPSRDVREHNEGTARFLLSIDARGKVQDCEIVRSSGHPRLDAATCKNVTRRARFEAASDKGGLKVAGTYSGTVRWVIPKD
ncbi:MAG: energy transducer TonB [Novosphingobium sp.]|nr:energy transducer TonB [Novosphingobium sp.]